MAAKWVPHHGEELMLAEECRQEGGTHQDGVVQLAAHELAVPEPLLSGLQGGLQPGPLGLDVGCLASLALGPRLAHGQLGPQLRQLLLQLAVELHLGLVLVLQRRLAGLLPLQEVHALARALLVPAAHRAHATSRGQGMRLGIWWFEPCQQGPVSVTETQILLGMMAYCADECR